MHPITFPSHSHFKCMQTTCVLKLSLVIYTSPHFEHLAVSVAVSALTAQFCQSRPGAPVAAAQTSFSKVAVSGRTRSQVGGDWFGIQSQAVSCPEAVWPVSWIPSRSEARCSLAWLQALQAAILQVARCIRTCELCSTTSPG